MISHKAQLHHWKKSYPGASEETGNFFTLSGKLYCYTVVSGEVGFLL